MRISEAAQKLYDVAEQAMPTEVHKGRFILNDQGLMTLIAEQDEFFILHIGVTLPETPAAAKELLQGFHLLGLPLEFDGDHLIELKIDRPGSV